MDITKFYELRERLYNTAAAGCMTVSEDFRLKRAVEDFKPLAEANKAFAKLFALCEKLLTAEKPESVIADCIALCDALAVTQVAFADNSAAARADGVYPTAEKPASAISAITAMISKSDTDLWKLSEEYRDTLRDPRVICAFIGALENGKFNENFQIFCEIMCEVCGKGLLPALKASVKDTGRQLRYIARLTGNAENELFRSDEKKDALKTVYENVCRLNDIVSSVIRRNLLENCSQEDCERIRAVGTYFAKKCMNTFGGYGVIVLIEQMNQEMSDAEYTEMLNTFIINTLKVKNAAERQLLFWYEKHLPPDEVVSAMENLLARVEKLRGDVDDKAIDDQKTLKRKSYRFGACGGTSGGNRQGRRKGQGGVDGVPRKRDEKVRESVCGAVRRVYGA